MLSTIAVLVLIPGNPSRRASSSCFPGTLQDPLDQDFFAGVLNA